MTKAQIWVINNAKEYNFGEESAFQFAERAYNAGAEETEKELADKLLDNWCRNKDDYCPHLKALETEFNTYKLKAKEIILSLYNAGRDILMCGYSEETQKRLDDRINSREIEKLLEE